ncbi:glycoside hydrolase family 18 protein, partial [Aaosphaeria arxii CBS 175.79]
MKQNCAAKAPCGIDSKDGKATCPLNGCCSSWGSCGFTDTFCTTGPGDTCQKNFGTCGIPAKPSCGQIANSATNGRHIGYYQGWNVRTRDCDKVWPSQLSTSGLTHLVYAYASIDDQTFQIKPDHPADADLYHQFTALKTDRLKTWIAVGGWTFSDPTSPTYHTWSKLASTALYRKAFVTSVVEFMTKYGFQGLDVAWEFPANPDRGGNDNDTQNMIALMKDLKQAFGSNFGLSTVLPADYVYLQGVDPLALHPYVDWFNFLSYDFHGPWELNSMFMKAKLRPHTSLLEIDNKLTPLWFNKVDASKINLGIAYYGRGFSADRNCLNVGCDAYGIGQQGSCTKQPGIMSNIEIHRLVEEKKLKPVLLKDEAVKQITWDDQWWSYDDNETAAMKLAFANTRCLGGVFSWAMDYDA